MTDLKPCREAFEEWFKSLTTEQHTKLDALGIWQAAWNRRRGEVKHNEEAISRLHVQCLQLTDECNEGATKHAALLDAVRGLRDWARDESNKAYVASQDECWSREMQERHALLCITYGKIKKALTRIIDEHKEGE